MSYRGSRTVNRPFGWVGPNGLNFSKAVNDPKSILARVVNFLRVYGPTTKYIILTDGLRKRVDIPEIRTDTYIYSPTYGRRVTTFRNVSRGYFSEAFAGMVHAGFIRHYRVGNTVLWELGDNADVVVNTVDGDL